MGWAGQGRQVTGYLVEVEAEVEVSGEGRGTEVVAQVIVCVSACCSCAPAFFACAGWLAELPRLRQE